MRDTKKRIDGKKIGGWQFKMQKELESQWQEHERREAVE